MTRDEIRKAVVQALTSVAPEFDPEESAGRHGTCDRSSISIRWIFSMS